MVSGPKPRRVKLNSTLMILTVRILERKRDKELEFLCLIKIPETILNSELNLRILEKVVILIKDHNSGIKVKIS